MVSSLRHIADCPRHGIVDITIYSQIMKDKRMKLEPFVKKGTFVGYKVSHIEEQEVGKDDRTYPSSLVAHPLGYQEEPKGPVDLPRNVVVTRKRPAWLRDTLQDAKKHTTPNDTFRERK